MLLPKYKNHNFGNFYKGHHNWYGDHIWLPRNLSLSIGHEGGSYGQAKSKTQAMSILPSKPCQTEHTKLVSTVKIVLNKACLRELPELFLI